MDMPPAGWYPDPYGAPDLLRWWDGSAWTQHTHEGSISQAPDAASTSLDMTRVGEAPGTAGRHASGTSIQRRAPSPATVQSAITARGPQDSTLVQPAAIQPGANPSWPN